MLISIIFKCVLTEVIMTVVLFIIDYASRGVFRQSKTFKEEVKMQEQMYTTLDVGEPGKIE